MPENSAARMNGFANGNGNSHHNGFESEDGQTFLFTSESVGEGHPGKIILFYDTFSFYFSFLISPQY